LLQKIANIVVIRKGNLLGDSMAKKIEVRCPHCNKSFFYYDSEFRPFCQERCQQIDLGNWSAGEYRVKSLTPLDEEDLEVVINAYEKENGYE
jgi:endogenous inhibitor of DNA gyrase (YacG/DUF329 family)